MKWWEPFISVDINSAAGYDMVWMEKMIGEHRNDQPAMIPFPEIGDRIG